MRSRCVWLSRDGLWALQVVHTCRDDAGRYASCQETCPAWEDLALHRTAGGITRIARQLGWMKAAPVQREPRDPNQLRLAS